MANVSVHTRKEQSRIQPRTHLQLGRPKPDLGTDGWERYRESAIQVAGQNGGACHGRDNKPGPERDERARPPAAARYLRHGGRGPKGVAARRAT